MYLLYKQTLQTSKKAPKILISTINARKPTRSWDAYEDQHSTYKTYKSTTVSRTLTSLVLGSRAVVLWLPKLGTTDHQQNSTGRTATKDGQLNLYLTLSRCHRIQEEAFTT